MERREVVNGLLGGRRNESNFPETLDTNKLKVVRVVALSREGRKRRCVAEQPIGTQRGWLLNELAGGSRELAGHTGKADWLAGWLATRERRRDFGLRMQISWRAAI